MAIALRFVVVLIVFVVLDMIWLAAVGMAKYVEVIGPLLSPDVRIPPALLFYALHAAGILVLVLPNARRTGSAATAALYGAMFGLCSYGTYDLTSQAVMRLWAWDLTLTDMSWGAIVTAMASYTGARFERWLAG